MSLILHVSTENICLALVALRRFHKIYWSDCLNYNEHFLSRADMRYTVQWLHVWGAIERRIIICG